MKSKAIIPLALGVVVGLVAIKFLVDTVQRAQGKPAETVTTFVARADIPASVEITAGMLAQVETPRSPLVPEGAFTSTKELVGRVTSKGIPQGSVISPLSLAPPGTHPGLTDASKRVTGRSASGLTRSPALRGRSGPVISWTSSW